jgi:hypothetical protein
VSNSSRCSAVALCALLAGCSGETKYIGTEQIRLTCSSAPSTPPSALGADPFYAKYLDAEGIPVLSSGAVADMALTQACEIVVAMGSARGDVVDQMIAHQARVAVIGQNELITELPEFKNLGPEWTDNRGGGATLDSPVSAAAEENLLCLSGDVYVGETIMIHAFAHGMRSLGIIPLDPTFDPRLQAAYDAALAAGKWANTFAATEYPQYWAEGVQSWFDANQQPDGLHNTVNTRVELAAYDPALYDLIAEYLPASDWRPHCP